MPGATVHPARRRWRSDEMRCDVLQGIGHFWRCRRCGEHGRIEGLAEARASARIHECEDLAPSERAEAS